MSREKKKALSPDERGRLRRLVEEESELLNAGDDDPEMVARLCAIDEEKERLLRDLTPSARSIETFNGFGFRPALTLGQSVVAVHSSEGLKKTSEFHDKVPIRTEGVFPIDHILLGTVNPSYRTPKQDPVLNTDCVAIPGDQPRICPRADPKPPPEFLPGIDRRFHELQLIGPGKSALWVGRQKRMETVCMYGQGCACFAEAPTTLVDWIDDLFGGDPALHWMLRQLQSGKPVTTTKLGSRTPGRPLGRSTVEKYIIRINNKLDDNPKLKKTVARLRRRDDRWVLKDTDKKMDTE
jgi:hypothetical protein